MAAWSGLGGGVVVGLAALLLAATVFAVHHAEVVALRVGEPFGSLVLAMAVTVIEVALIVSMMLFGGEAKAALARDTVCAAAMLILNGLWACASSPAAPGTTNRNSRCAALPPRWRHWRP
jgi:Ca2+:H+ antiporter